ncbi:DUF1194 domain-containing protein [Histidinibacterium aquaticum]|uniref:DUF1194 domain-containing protein n=1 Tax=Histidinibacterium aquaticum TaxID=2613962 RepID=A0A5J5GNI6_9RHOB|nr:DUF1194 domain-containing protein [Histidinibacterium aquaticum]KAA9009859.1 DUF1194 domain-containing protein [Histidinibacterium aquaticum]
MIRALVAAVLLLSGPAWAQCRQALALGLDVSGSVDAQEYRMQLDGLAAALSNEEVSSALLEGSGTVRIAVYEWSGPRAHRILLPWTEIAGAADIAVAAGQLRATARVRSEPTTAIGAAMEMGGAMLSEQAACWQSTLDLSGDGKSNTGPRPQDVPEAALPPGTTVNGLVIGAEAEDAGRRRLVAIGELVAYYRAYVIRGPGSFVEVAMGFEDYEAAMTRKLLRELRSLAIGGGAASESRG